MIIISFANRYAAEIHVWALKQPGEMFLNCSKLAGVLINDCTAVENLESFMSANTQFWTWVVLYRVYKTKFKLCDVFKLFDLHKALSWLETIEKVPLAWRSTLYFDNQNSSYYFEYCYSYLYRSYKQLFVSYDWFYHNIKLWNFQKR